MYNLSYPCTHMYVLCFNPLNKMVTQRVIKFHNTMPTTKKRPVLTIVWVNPLIMFKWYQHGVQAKRQPGELLWLYESYSAWARALRGRTLHPQVHVRRVQVNHIPGCHLTFNQTYYSCLYNASSIKLWGSMTLWINTLISWLNCFSSLDT